MPIGCRFARDKPRLLDLACGRGGDLHKWVGAGVRYVKGLDLSPNEIDEARRRYEELLTRKANLKQRFRAEFEPSDILGVQDWVDEPGAPQYDVATCMFAIHYFFVTEAGLKQFMRNVSLNLKTGGHFVGTCPDGKQVMSAIGGKGEAFKSPALILRKLWRGNPACFGSSFKCAIHDTVTQGLDEEGGSEEFLVFWNVLKALAEEVGLTPVAEYNDDLLDSSFLKGDKKHPFKHFNPRFDRSHPSLETASALNVAFVFQKTVEPAEISAARMQKRKAEEESLDDEDVQPAKKSKMSDQNGHAPPSSSPDPQQAPHPNSASNPEDSRQQAFHIQSGFGGSSLDDPAVPHAQSSPTSHKANIHQLSGSKHCNLVHTANCLPSTRPDSVCCLGKHSSSDHEAASTCSSDQPFSSKPHGTCTAAPDRPGLRPTVCTSPAVQQTPLHLAQHLYSGSSVKELSSMSPPIHSSRAMPIQTHGCVPMQLSIPLTT